MFTEYDSYLFHEGTMYDSYEKMGAHPAVEDGVEGVRFTVWAEHARDVKVVIFGSAQVPMKKINGGFWEVFIPEIKKGAIYKYLITGADGAERWKADPYAFYTQMRPDNASIVWGLNDYGWTDGEYMKNIRPYLMGVPGDDRAPYGELEVFCEKRAAAEWAAGEARWKYDEAVKKYALQQEEAARSKAAEKDQKAALLKDKTESKEKAEHITKVKLAELKKDAELKAEEAASYVWKQPKSANQEIAESSRKRPMSIYEVHLGSWKKDYRFSRDGFLNYRRLADELSEYVEYMGFTHVEVMGISEYPFDGSWGYQVTGYYSPTSRHGNPDDFKYFVDKMHSRGIGVIIDWVPAHFPKDIFGLVNFDGTPTYESSDPLLAEYPEWGTHAFDHSKPEVKCFLISNALYWVREFHADALRVDAVAAMIFTSFSRSEWRPNKYGENKNLGSIAFLKQLNRELIDRTGSFLIAEDSSQEQGITKSVYDGGFGFMYKWNMGWMNDTLEYFKKEPIYRKYHFDALTHTADYVYTEFFVNVLSHDEVVHLKKSMVGKMPGLQPDKLSGLKCLYTYQFTHPGKKLLFMGQEFAMEREWDENREIDWFQASDVWHRDIMMSLRKLLQIYKSYRVLYEDSNDPRTFEWVNRNDKDRGILAYIRRNPDNYDDALLVLINTTPVQYNKYSCGVPEEGMYQRIFCSGDTTPGSGMLSEETPPLVAVREVCDGYDYKITYDLRPNECVIVRFPVR